MRVLFSAIPAYGHFQPMGALATALTAAGHEVVVATGPDLCPRVAQAGFTPIATGPTKAAAFAAYQQRFPEAATVPVARREVFAYLNLMGRIVAAARTDDLVPLARAWGADLIVHDPGDLAGPLAADVVGIPSVLHSWGPAPPAWLAEAVAPVIAELWGRWGRPGGPADSSTGHLYLDVCPPCLQAADAFVEGPVQAMRPVPLAPAVGEVLPASLGRLRWPTTVLVTLGTVVNKATAVFVAVLDGLAEEPVNVVVTVGPDVDPSIVGPRPAHVVVERYIPLSLVLGLCDVVVHHGGAGTMLAACAQGLPQLVMPQAKGQMQSAELLVATGAARSLPTGGITPAAVRAAVVALREDHHRGAAGHIALEIAAMPDPSVVVGVLERLAGSAESRAALPGSADRVLPGPAAGLRD